MNEQTILNFKKLFCEIKKNEMIALNASDKLEVVKVTGDEADTVVLEQEKNLKRKLNLRKQLYLNKIEDAMFRLENGEFGSCCECGNDISLTRLHARPTATECIDCKEEMERDESNKFTGKAAGSLNANSNVVSINSGEAFEEEGQLKSISMDKVLKFNKNRISNEALF